MKWCEKYSNSTIKVYAITLKQLKNIKKTDLGRIYSMPFDVDRVRIFNRTDLIELIWHFAGSQKKKQKNEKEINKIDDNEIQDVQYKIKSICMK